VNSLAACVLAVIMGPHARGDQRGRGNAAADLPALPYKLVEWPTLPISAAGVPAGPWNFIQVASVAVTPRGTILVLHRGAHPLLEFESTGTFVRSWGSSTRASPEMVPIISICQRTWPSRRMAISTSVTVTGPPGW